MAVFKIHMTLKIMLEADSEAEANAMIEGRSLSQVAYEIDDGDWIGVTAFEETEEVTPGNLKSELEAMGNDGSFFGDDQGGG